METLLLLLLLFAICAGSLGIINCLESIHKCEKNILKELRHKQKDDDE